MEVIGIVYIRVEVHKCPRLSSITKVHPEYISTNIGSNFRARRSKELVVASLELGLPHRTHAGKSP